jgi:hypothetical protein
MLKPLYTVTALEGIRSYAEKYGVEVEYAPGVIASRYLPVPDKLARSPTDAREAYNVEFFREDPITVRDCEPTLSFTVNTSSGCLVSFQHLLEADVASLTSFLVKSCHVSTT